MIREAILDEEKLKIPTHEKEFDVQSICLAQDLKDSLRYGWSQGKICKSLSSNQIGFSERAIAYANRLGGKIEVMFNPRIVLSRGEQEFWEDNFFMPEKMFKILRAYEIGVQFVSEKGRQCVAHYYGESAALIQQEIDNLNGVLPRERAQNDADIMLKSPNPIYLDSDGSKHF